MIEAGWVDALRVARPEEPKIYTRWLNFAQAYERNRGWRIDHQLITPDHAPVVIDYDISLEG